MGAQPPRVVMEAGSNDTMRPLYELKRQLRQGRRARSGGDHPTELTAAAPAPVVVTNPTDLTAAAPAPVVVTNPTDLTAAAPPLTNAAQTDQDVPGETQIESDGDRPGRGRPHG